MPSRTFFLLYLCCLAVCVGGVEGARVAVGALPEAAGPVDLAPLSIAIPPKPEGTRGPGPEGREGRGGQGGSRYDEATCARYEGDFRDVCFHALARQRAPRDLPGALLACAEVRRARLAQECSADAAELHVPADLQASRAVCPTIPARKWRDQCFFGIAMALVPTDPRLALATCEDAGIWRDFCRHDTLGEASVQDLDLVLEVCGREEGDLLTRKTCWHGIGKYIGREDLPRALAACARVPPGPGGLYRENCVHGAGWASGERSGAAGAEACAQAGPLEDACRVGVAFQVLASDPTTATGVCGSLRRSDLRRHCLAWLERR